MKKIFIISFLFIASSVSASYYMDLNEAIDLISEGRGYASLTHGQKDLARELAKDWDSYMSELEEEEIFGAWNPAGGLTYRLQSSIGTTNTTIKLSSFKNRSDIPLNMTVLASDIGYGTLSPQTSRSEFVSFTGVTQNSDGTAVLTGVSRGLSDISPFTASTTLREAHPGQSVFILSDSPQVFEEYASRRSDDTITGTWTFSALPISSVTPTTATQFVNKDYVDGLTNQGAATSTELNGGIVELATEIEVASSTATTTVKPIVIQAQNATSTPQSGCDGSTTVGKLCIPVAEEDGKLGQLWTDLSEGYDWTGLHTHSATTSFAGLAASSTAAKPLKLNDINYAFPSNEGASSTVLTTDGGGNLSWNNLGWEELISTTTSVAMATATTTFPAREELNIRISIPNGISSASFARISFSSAIEIGDTLHNSRSWDWTSATPVVTDRNNKGDMRLFASNSTTSQMYFDINIHNEETLEKAVTWEGAIFTTGAIPMRVEGVGNWASTTAQITSAAVWTGDETVTMPAGTQIKVFGR